MKRHSDPDVHVAKAFLNFTKPKDPKDSHHSLGPQTGRAEKTVDSWIITL